MYAGRDIIFECTELLANKLAKASKEEMSFIKHLQFVIANLFFEQDKNVFSTKQDI